MAYQGTIVSHDPALHVGLIMPVGGSHAVQFTEGDVINWDRASYLLGRPVTFEAVQTPNGVVAVYIQLAVTKRRTLRLPVGEWPATIITPLLVPLLTYLLSRYFFLSHIFTYLLSINLITFILFAIVTGRGWSRTLQPSEILLLTLMALGGSPAYILGLFLFRSRFQTQGFALLLAIVLAGQFLIVRNFYPGLLTTGVWRFILEENDTLPAPSPPPQPDWRRPNEIDRL